VFLFTENSPRAITATNISDFSFLKRVDDRWSRRRRKNNLIDTLRRTHFFVFNTGPRHILIDSFCDTVRCDNTWIRFGRTADGRGDNRVESSDGTVAVLVAPVDGDLGKKREKKRTGKPATVAVKSRGCESRNALSRLPPGLRRRTTRKRIRATVSTDRTC